MIFRIGMLAAVARSPAAPMAAEKETPSTVDIQKHNTSIGNAIGQAAMSSNSSALIISAPMRFLRATPKPA